MNVQYMDSAQVLKAMFNPDTGGINTSPVHSFIPVDYDAIEMAYTGDDLTQVMYKKQGAVVCTLVLTYTDGKLSQVEKS